MPSFPSSKIHELRRHLEERDEKGSRKRRWQLKTVMAWLGLEAKRFNRAGATAVEEALRAAGIEAYPALSELTSAKDRVNLTLSSQRVESPPPPQPLPSITSVRPTSSASTKPAPCSAPKSSLQRSLNPPLAPAEDALLLGGLFLKHDDNRHLVESCHLPLQDLVTHTFICGTTGSGKTVNLKILVEEAALKGIPAILVDLKGDLTSLALPLTAMDKTNLEPWVEVASGTSRSEAAAREASKLTGHWRKQRYGELEFQKFRKQVAFSVYTPRSRKGTHQMGVSFVANPPSDWKELYANEPELVRGMIRDSSMALLLRLYPKIEKVTREMGFLEELILTAWGKELDLQGRRGLQNLVRLIQNPPEELKDIGAMSLDAYLPASKRMELASQVNNLLVGVNSIWFDGVSADDIETILAGSNGKTRIAVINMAELDFHDRAFVLSHLGYGIFRWARKMGGASLPRLIFAVDEIGGGGGKEAFFPPHPYVSVSKPALNLLLRQGRAFGICCILATQNPGDIDYKGLSNCQTWIIGRLATKRDRDKIRQGICDAEVNFGDMDQVLASVEPGEFVIHKKSGAVEHFRQRWLLTYHKALSAAELDMLCRLREIQPTKRSER